MSILLWSPSFLSSQAVSSQSPSVPSLGLLSNPCVPASSPCLHQLDTCVRMGHTDYGRPSCRSHSILHATDHLLHYPPSTSSSLSVQLIPHLLRDFPRQEPLFTFNLQPVTLVLSFFHSFYFSSFIYLTQLCWGVSYPFKC